MRRGTLIITMTLVYIAIVSAIVKSCICIADKPVGEPMVVIGQPVQYRQQNVVYNTISKEEPINEVIDVEEAPNSDFHSGMSCDWDIEDEYLLMKIAMAEAEGEDTEGKALVMMVILNRVASDEFPDTIYDVIHQKRGDTYQFSPVGNGRFNRVEPNEDCQKALDMIMIDKWDGSQGALYFESCKGESWHSRNLDFLFEHGGHRFYK